jgi:hypothetical protein
MVTRFRLSAQEVLEPFLRLASPFGLDFEVKIRNFIMMCLAKKSTVCSLFYPFNMKNFFTFISSAQSPEESKS